MSDLITGTQSETEIMQDIYLAKMEGRLKTLESNYDKLAANVKLCRQVITISVAIGLFWVFLSSIGMAKLDKKISATEFDLQQQVIQLRLQGR